MESGVRWRAFYDEMMDDEDHEGDGMDNATLTIRSRPRVEEGASLI